MSFPRDLKKSTLAAVEATQFGPIPIQSPIKENTKFMNLRQLRRLYADEQQSSRIKDRMNEFFRHDQELQYVGDVRDQLNSTRRYAFQTARGDEYVIRFGEDVSALEKGGAMWVRSTVPAEKAEGVRRIRVQQIAKGRTTAVMQCREIEMRVWPRRGGQIDISLRLGDVVTQGEGVTASPSASPATLGPSPAIPPASSPTASVAGTPTARAVISLSFRIPMPASIAELETRPLDYYVSPGAAASGNQPRLKHELIKLRNSVVSEMHVRAAFSLSCVILVLVGCALGMMFRSGNFLNAFAISFVPALLAITLIIAGQQVCGDIPWQGGGGGSNPLNRGIGLIWSGNLANLAIAAGLLWKLARI
jgi:hypothetical protein